MKPPRILVVEDEPNLANTLELNLRLEGYDPIVASSGSQALHLIETRLDAIDLAILDVMLPDTDGYELCRQIRSRSGATPVIFLTAKADKSSTLEGLRLGADDYLKKPFDLEELLLRISNLLKRSAAQDHPVPAYSFGKCEVNFRTFEIIDAHGKKHTLSKREIGLLQLLTSNPGKVISRDEILEHLWAPDENASARTIDNYILGFRKLFETKPRDPLHFHSIRGVGYKFTAQ
jgi:two-component system, OmpR family, alkaline phosphatase synthesis response regulator PhoP